MTNNDSYDRTPQFSLYCSRIARRISTTQLPAAPIPQFSVEASCLFLRLREFSDGVTLGARCGSASKDDSLMDEVRACKAEIDVLENEGDEIAKNSDGKAVQKSVMSALYSSLKSIMEVLEKRQIVKLQQAKERSKFFAPSVPTAPAYIHVTESEPSVEMNAVVQAECRNEAQLLLSRFSNDLEEVTVIQKKLMEVSSLMTVFGTKVHEQSEMVMSVFEEAEQAVAHMSEAKKELRRADESSGWYRIYLVCGFFLAGLILLWLDYFTTRRRYL